MTTANNNPRKILDHLFHLAGSVQKSEDLTPPLGLETRILATWRSHQAQASRNAFVYRRAALLACAFTLAVFTITHLIFPASIDPRLWVANAALHTSLLP